MPGWKTGEYPQDAACLDDADPDAWFPTGVEEILSPRTQRAIQVCHWCPVRVQCGRGADERHERYGVWGGVPRSNRETTRELRRSRQDQDAMEARAASHAGHVAVCGSCPTVLTGDTFSEVTAEAWQHTNATGHSWTYSGPKAATA